MNYAVSSTHGNGYWQTSEYIYIYIYNMYILKIVGRAFQHLTIEFQLVMAPLSMTT